MKRILKPINTVFSVDSILDIKELVEAKILMNEKYGNKYSHIPPHLAYVIMPFPEKSLEKGIEEVTSYINKQKPFPVQISNLKFEEKNNFFYVDIHGNMIKKLHEDFIGILNKYRGRHIREKDLDRLKNGDFDEKTSSYLRDFGNARVFDNFKTHITVGNFTIENVNVDNLKSQLLEILKPILDKEIIIDNIHGVFHTDSAGNQSEMKQMWDKVFPLK